MSVMLKAKGLHTYANDLDAVPKGSLQKAKNTVIDRDGVIESRRGFKQYADINADQIDRAKQLLEYKDRMIVHYANKLAFDNGSGILTDFSGSYQELQLGLRIKALEANGNFFFTTLDGIKKISATSSNQFTSNPNYIRDAGGIEALDITAKVNYSTPGFLVPKSKVAYRVVWAYKDTNENLILGAPSPLTVVTNASENADDSAVVDLTFPIPNEIGPTDTQFYYQVYRTAVKVAGIQPLDDVSPGDEMYLVLEDYPTTNEITTTRVITLQDITPEDFRASGTLLYTNPNSGEGILQANTPPPIAKDITMYQESVFYANTQTKQYLDLSFLSVSQLVSGVSTFTITTGGITNTYTFVGSPEITEIEFDSVANTNDGGYFLISSAGNVREYFVWADKTGTTAIPDDVDTEGRIGLRVDLTYSSTTDIPVVGSVSPGGVFDITNTEVGAGDQPQSTDITFDTFANTTDAGYFLINSNNNDSLFFVWLDKTGTTPQPTAPDTVGRTAIHVDISSSISDNDIAIAVANELSSIGLFTSSVSGGVMTVDTNITFNEVAGRVGDVLTATGDFLVDRTNNLLEITTSDNGYTNLTIDGDTAWGGALFDITTISTGTGEDIANKQILLSNAPTPAQAIDNTARSLIRVVNQTPTESVYAFYLSDETSLPGTFYLQSRDVANPPFFVFVDDPVTSTQFNPPLPVELSGTTNTGNPTVTITSTAHGLNNGQNVVIFNSTTDPIINGIYTISNVTVNTFDIQALVNVSGNVSFGITNDVFSTNEIKPNRLYYSKYQQPEAVPIVNYLDIGPKDKSILRILALRDSLFIFKEEAIYRLTGTMAPDWTVTLFDSSGVLLAPDSAVVLNNQIYCLTTQGIARITDTGFGVISRPIEDKIQKIIYQNPSFKTASFGVSYETDRAYLLWVPLNKSDSEASYCLRFNTFTESWTEWDKDNVSGRVMTYNDKLYLGATSNIIEEERKNLERTDYADYEHLKVMGPNAINGKEVTLNSNLGMTSGDIVVQYQYLTIATYNRLITRLDSDILVSDNDYFASLKMIPGDNLTNSMTNLVIKLNSDPSTQSVYTFSGTTNFEQIQQEYNVIIDTLNNDPGVYMSDYRHSLGIYLAEMRVDRIIHNTNRIVTNQVPPLVVGDMIHYVAIETDIIYTPQDFDDPSQYKQISEATFLFEDSVFTSAKAGYNSDLSPSFEFIPFTADGDGDWGNFAWSEQSWGGEGDQVPLRTYIPREKQRCRFLRPRFIHNNAWEHYAIFGISFNPRAYSTRSYR